ncbi:GDSL-like Lipase/Acylhydrolase family protein [Actinoplanes derwentensis]|uniref:GDSL-like Lipase/Acylhydrolase family protein n=2 Tax=Actinoplanes derwentensis TaxID=113562 RepID=A0A1H1SFQ9_9ACTN|nr:GDSL-like Lipase/Acylhydrolase family protein [Actinoplanes derwentensis]
MLWLLFAIFIGVATVWIRGQYADSLDGRQWVIPYWVGIPVSVLAAGLVSLLFVQGRGTADKGLLGISGLVLLFLAAGSWLTHVRQRPSVRLPGRHVRTGHYGAYLTVIGLALVVAGAALLGPARQVLIGALILGAGLFLLVPVGLALWSEGILRWLCEHDVAPARLWSLGAAGLLVFAGGTTAAVYASNSRWLTVVLVILGLLVAALVSTTQADIVTVTAVIALMGVTPAPATETGPPDLTHRERKVLVALGDSFMSGEGAQVYYRGTDEGGGNECRRSPTAWVVTAAQDRAHFDGLKFVACSAARTQNLLPEHGSSFYVAMKPGRIDMPKPERQRGEAHTQLDAAHGPFTPAMVVLSIGGNDAGFSTIGLMCLAPGDCRQERRLWLDSVPQLREQLRVTYREVNRAFPNVPVVVVPYPDPIKVRRQQCDQVALSENEQRFIHEYLTGSLNATIRDTAREFRFHYLAEMQEALVAPHLQLCDERNGDRPGINFIGLRSVRGLADQRFNPANWLHSSLHPNERGHAAMLRVFETWMAEHPQPIPPRVRPQPGEPVGLPLGNREPKQKAPCDLFDTTRADGCRPQGQEWAFQQVGRVLLDDLLWLWLAVACAGAWAAAIAFFASRRRVWAARTDAAGTPAAGSPPLPRHPDRRSSGALPAPPLR